MQLSFDSFRETRNEGLKLPSGMNFKMYVSSRLQLRHKWLSFFLKDKFFFEQSQL